MTPTSYTAMFSRLAKWTLGHRTIHDLVLHPLMAITGYADWTVRLHDFQAFKTSKPEDDDLLGVTGSMAVVEKAIAIIGGNLRHYHRDGMLCFGIIDTNTPLPKPGSKKDDGITKLISCPRCNGTCFINGWNQCRYERIKCTRCFGAGRIPK